MRGRRPEPLTIAPPVADTLRAVAHSDSLPWFQVRRARIVLALAAGERRRPLAARLDCDEATVWRTCERYRREGLAALFSDSRQGRSGRLEEISPVQRAQIVELACLDRSSRPVFDATSYPRRTSL
jgi:hypothetical protein